MSNVTLQIHGHSFAIACAAGEEDHARNLGRLISEKLATLPNAGSQSEARMLLFASLLLADEVHELRKTAASAASQQGAASTPIAPLIEEIAGRLENLANQLES